MRTALLSLLLLTATSHAAVVATGLAAVAVSGDGKRVAVAGQNRVVYLLDADKAEVKSRIWLGVRVADLAFNRDGTRLLVTDEVDQIHLLDLASGKVLARVARVDGLETMPAINRAATRDLADATKYKLRLLTLESLAEGREIELPDRPVAWRFGADGKRLFVLGAGKRGDEILVPATEVPSDLRGLARWTFRQKNDGQESTLYEVDIESGKILSQAKSWYTSDTDSTRLARLGETTYVLNRVNQCAKIGPKGITTMFETPMVVNHAIATSTDGKTLWLGGQGGGSVGPIEGGARVAFKLDELPGQAEFVNRFAVDAAGAWAVTSSFRVLRVSRAGRVERLAAVY